MRQRRTKGGSNEGRRHREENGRLMIDTGCNQGGEGNEEAGDDTLMLMMPCWVTLSQLHS